MRFTPEFIERVREANDVVELIGQHVQLKKMGASLKGLCPFHGEKTPSFNVNEAKQVYHCFGCGKGGNVYTFVRDYQGMTFPEAVEYLAGRASIPLPALDKESIKQAKEVTDERETLLKVNRYVAAHQHRLLSAKAASHVVKQYIAKRGITDEMVNEFKLGYAEPGWSDLTNVLKRAKAPLWAAEKLGLIKKKQNGDFFDLFRDRLMFPILTSRGEVVGFGGRSLGEQQPKYINSTDSPVFHKGKTLYGLHVTFKHIREKNEAYVVEGYMDLLTLYQYGIHNVVATLGTAFTADHAKVLRKICDKVIVLFDGDEAGQVAADKSLPIFLEAGLMPRLLTLPGERDPDEFLRELGAEEFHKLSRNAPDQFSALLARKTRHFKGLPGEKVELLNGLVPVLERVRDQRLRMFYLQEVATTLEVTPQWVAQQLRQNTSQKTEIAEQIEKEAKAPKAPTEESILVQFMLEKPEYLELINASGVIEKFVSAEARMVAQQIAERYCQNPNDFDRLGASLITQAEGYSGVQELLTNQIAFRASDGLQEDLNERQRQFIQDCIERVKDRDLRVKSKSILNSIKADRDSSAEKLEIFLKIAREHKGPKNP